MYFGDGITILGLRNDVQAAPSSFAYLTILAMQM